MRLEIRDGHASYAVSGNTELMETTFESMCYDLEQVFAHDADLICVCCSVSSPHKACRSCEHALGLHRCDVDGCLRWRPNTLYGGKLDVVSVVWGMARKNVPLDVLKAKIADYVAASLLPSEEAEDMVLAFEQMR